MTTRIECCVECGENIDLLDEDLHDLCKRCDLDDDVQQALRARREWVAGQPAGDEVIRALGATRQELQDMGEADLRLLIRNKQPQIKEALVGFLLGHKEN